MSGYDWGDLSEAKRVLSKSQTVTAAANSLGVSENALGKAFRRRGELASSYLGQEEFLEIPEEHSIPEEIDIEELLARRKSAFKKKRAREEAMKLVPVKVKKPGPIGILHFGDPHVDDDGTDLEMLLDHARLVQETDGLFAGNVGDTTNNWVGRLARLYAEQSTTASEAWALCEHFVASCPWLYMVGGNHDFWSGSGDPIKWMQSSCLTPKQETNIRFELQFPNGRKCRNNIRHDFAGHSMWNAAHGSNKAFTMGFKDNILLNGHKHISGYNVLVDEATGTVGHCIQVSSYKIYDRFAKEKGFRGQHISPCALTVVDPDASEAGFVHVFWDPYEGADYLKFKRRNLR